MRSTSTTVTADETTSAPAAINPTRSSPPMPARVGAGGRKTGPPGIPPAENGLEAGRDGASGEGAGRGLASAPADAATGRHDLIARGWREVFIERARKRRRSAPLAVGQHADDANPSPLGEGENITDAQAMVRLAHDATVGADLPRRARPGGQRAALEKPRVPQPLVDADSLAQRAPAPRAACSARAAKGEASGRRRVAVRRLRRRA